MLELRLCVTSKYFSVLWLPCFGGVARRYYGGLSRDGQVACSRIEVKVLFGDAHVLPLLMSILMLNVSTSTDRLYKQIVYQIRLKCPLRDVLHRCHHGTRLHLHTVLCTRKVPPYTRQYLWNTPVLSSVWHICCTEFLPNQNLNVEDKDRNLLTTVRKVRAICKQMCYSLYLFEYSPQGFYFPNKIKNTDNRSISCTL